MFAWLSTGTELRRFSKGVLPRLAVLVMLFIPLLYGVLYLWAFWDPVGNMNHLPVALVNEDVGTTVNGEHENFGDQVVKKLDDRQDLKWKRTSASAASDGVKDGTYYFSVTLPKAFSRQAVSPSTSTPTSPQIMVRYNDSNSFLASTLGKEAMSQVRAAIAQQFGTRYAKTALVGLQSARGGLVQAADGSGQITDGLTTAQAGTQQLNVGLGTLTDGMAQLSSGSSTLSASTQQLAAGAAKLDGGAQSLASGALSANSGAQSLASGSATVSSGSKNLAAGLSSASSSTKELLSGAENLQDVLQQAYGQPQTTTTPASGSQKLAAGASDTDTKLRKIITGIQEKLDTAKSEAGTASPYLTAETDVEAAAILRQIVATSTDGAVTNATCDGVGALPTSSLAATVSQLCAARISYQQTLALIGNLQQLEDEGTSPVATGASQLSSDLGQISHTVSEPNVGLVSGVTELSNGLTQLSDGASSLASGSSSLAGGAASLASGTSQLSSGASTLASGTSAVASGSSQLASGASALNEGVASAASGASTAKSGAQQLADGSILLKQGSQTLTQRLQEGATAIPHSSPTTVNAQAKVVGNPTVLKQSWVHNAKVFGVGFAPFFISLALFVGGIITWLLLRALPTRALAAGVSGLRAALSGFLPAALFGIGQVAIMLAVIVFGLGMSPVYPVTTVLFTLLACFSFLALQQMFIITLGPAAGRVVALALLMFQLSSSGGTYPVETTPGFFRAITHYMPITYVVNGLRETITGGIDARFWTALAVLLVVLIGSLAISAASAAHQRQWTIARLHPDLVI